MKKLVLMLAVVFSVSLFSCGGNKAQEAEAEPVAVEEAEVVAVEAVPDSAACDSTETPAEAPAETPAAE